MGLLASQPGLSDPPPSTAPEGNLVLADGTTDPAALTSKVINGTYAHISIRLATDGTYTLQSPDLSTLSAVTASKEWLRRDVAMTWGWGT